MANPMIRTATNFRSELQFGTQKLGKLFFREKAAKAQLIQKAEKQIRRGGPSLQFILKLVKETGHIRAEETLSWINGNSSATTQQQKHGRNRDTSGTTHPTPVIGRDHHCYTAADIGTEANTPKFSELSRDEIVTDVERILMYTNTFMLRL